MAIFRYPYTSSVQLRCAVCRKKADKGVRLHTAEAPIEFSDSYATVFPPIEAKRAVHDAYICRSCAQQFFGTQGRTEAQTWRTAYRPAAIRSDEFPVRRAFPEGMLRDLCGILLLILTVGVLRLICGALPVFRLCGVLCACLTGAEAVFAAVSLVQGAFSGMGRRRMLCIAAVLVTFLLLTVILLMLCKP